MIPKREYQNELVFCLEPIMSLRRLSNCVLCRMFFFSVCCLYVLFNVFFVLDLEIFTNRHRCQAFFEHIVQSNLVASICTSLESRTNRNRDELQSNQFHRNHHNVWIFDRCSIVDRTNRRWPMMRRHVFANIVDNFGNRQQTVPVYLLLLTHHIHLDKKFRQPTY